MESALLDGLNDQQQAAVTHTDGPLLIVAGAGTGKTTVVTRRIAWLIEQGRCTPDQILALTFTDKAAGEMEERVDRLLPYGYVNLWISTFHSFCERILKRHALDIGLPNDFTLLDTTASWMLVRKNFDRFDLDYYRPLGNPTKFIHAILKHFSRLKDEAITPNQYLEYAESLRLDADAAPGVADEKTRIAELANAYHTYQQLLLENGAFDFGDLILSALTIFKMRTAILESYRSAFPYILVDEFQDTNSAQYELIKKLSAPRNNLTVVGDDDQAIFRWRGASFENIVSFKRDFPESAEIVLTQNYRSPQNILDRAYSFIQQNNPNRLEHRLGEQGSALSKKLLSADQSPGRFEHLQCATLEDEVSAVIDKIVELKKSHAEARQSEGGWGDFLILVRANDSADPFLAKCAAEGIPYRFLAQKGLFATPVVIDLSSYFAVLVNCHDSPALYRVLTWPLWDVSHSAVVELSHIASKKSISLWVACAQIDLLFDIADADRERIKNIRGLLERHGSLCRTVRMTELFLSIIKDTGLLASMSTDANAEVRERLALVNEFFSKIKAFQTSDPHGRLRDFMTLLSYEQEAGDEGSLARLSELDPDAVAVMTIHGSKGLEFPFVFLVGMVDQRFPTRERGDAIPLPSGLVGTSAESETAHLEEERRLMYVAVTRAKAGFFCSSAENYGGNRKRKPSQFLSELGFVPIPETRIMKPETFTQYNSTADAQKNEQANVSRFRFHVSSPVAPRNDSFKLPSSFSFSQLVAFRACPLQYKFSFLLKIPTFGKPHFSFGKSIHETLQKFAEAVIVQAGKNQPDLFGKAEKSYTASVPPKETLIELFEQSWIDEWYGSKKIHDEYKEKGRAMLMRFHDDFCASGAILKTVERDFSVKIPFGGDQGHEAYFTLKGRIDRIDLLPSGSIEIVDYKTGSPKDAEKLAFADKEQLLLYQFACGNLGETVEQLTYHYLEGGSKVTFLGSDKDVSKVLDKAEMTVDELRTSDFSATPGWHCRYCDYRDICEYRQ